MKSRLFIVAAMLGLLATACNKDEVTPQDDMTTKTPITINASYGSGNNGSKVSYTESGNTISATWQSGDKLLVVYNNNVNTLDLVDGAGENTATFSGDITGTPTEGAMLVCYVKDQNTPNGTITVNGDGSYIYTSDAFLGQDGTLAGASKLNLYCGWTRYSSTSNISCTFGVNTSMMKFTVTGISADAGETATIAYTSGGTEVAKTTFTVVAGDNLIYLSIPSGQYTGEQALEYSCNGTDLNYRLSNTQANFTAGQTYSKNIEFFDARKNPLTFEAKTAGATVTFTPGSEMSISIEYSTDGSTWTSYSSTITLPNIGDKVMFRGNNATYSRKEYDDGDLYLYSSSFSCSGECYLYGNIMSLINATNFASRTSLSSTNFAAFRRLFSNNTALYSHTTKKIVLPATTLSDYCYSGMFYGCTHLTTAPALPATTLAEECYSKMFYGCTNLSTAPELPATTLAENCYYSMFERCSTLNAPPQLRATSLAKSCYGNMFKDCTGLNSAPSLPATTLAQYCYSSMFYGCTSLAAAPNLPATTLSNDCYSYMFYGCSNLSSAPASLPATTLKSNCYAFMFYRCSSLTTAPTLPAETVTDWCYYSMFSGCTNLNSVTCLAKYNFTSASMWYNSWLSGVAATGTFTKAAAADWTSYGIPSGWTVNNQ